MRSKFRELGCEFKNPAECQEDLDEERVDLDAEERNFFGDND